MQNRILLVSVLYNERLADTKTYTTLLQGGGTDVLIVENSPQPLNSKADLPASWHYVSFPDNPGLGAAYNYTADFARQHGYDWILLTDQDTAFPPGILEQYRSAVERHPSVKLFCPQVSIGPDRFMSPVPMNRYRCNIQRTAPTGEISLSAYSVINSGMLIHVETFIQAGGYRPEVHLDFADFQFIERFRKVSPKAFVIDAVCQQEFSNEVQTREQKLSRYRLFCQSLRNFVCDDCKNQKYLHRIVFRRACSLAVSEKTFRPFRIFYTDYWV
ncbi:glycosyltransferase [uncultured Alistipes sp.]|uniref:glycosyltransferase n=1 Tax=uncultured Alistipes sp. TaxID=538949 RepID=UPI00266F92D4|nr:glycosyltransferase [uncultured Alistipes sp.]